MTNKWIKPSELPEGFWSECFVATSGYFDFLYPDVKMLKKKEGKVYVYLDYEEDRGWVELQPDSDKVKTRLMIIERPVINKEDFQ